MRGLTKRPTPLPVLISALTKLEQYRAISEALPGVPILANARGPRPPARSPACRLNGALCPLFGPRRRLDSEL